MGIEVRSKKNLGRRYYKFRVVAHLWLRSQKGATRYIEGRKAPRVFYQWDAGKMPAVLAAGKMPAVLFLATGAI
jgi:hypothetical protein